MTITREKGSRSVVVTTFNPKSLDISSQKIGVFNVGRCKKMNRVFFGIEKKTSMIGLIGRKGSGKDTVADYLVSRHGYKKHAFAAPLKRVCRELFLLDEEQMHQVDQKEKVDARWNMSPRQMMQMVGTDMVRKHLGIDFWLHHMTTTIAKEDEPTKIVISDVRFANEADWIRRHGGRLIRVIGIREDKDEDVHASEQEQDQIVADEEILNDHGMGLEAFHDSLGLRFATSLPRNT